MISWPCLPIPVFAAAELAERYNKSLVVILSYDAKHGLLHTTTWGRPRWKKVAAEFGDFLTQAAGGDLSKATIFEDFRRKLESGEEGR
ncbi:MAG TPA: hypothetical protein VFA26_05280 [Gemmataceae bacterium]|nr:hypothetical protein [Gemmataceae bacterium]